MLYTPDKWIIVDMNTVKKVFATWLGGYLNGETWKLSSGTLEIKDCGDYWELPQYSGSVYKLFKDSEGTTMWSMDVLEHLLEPYPEYKIVFLTPEEVTVETTKN